MVNKLRIDRRTCLKGLGATLSLPLLETMGWADSGKGQTVKSPVRLGFMYMPHGVIPDQFWPANAENFLTSPPPALESLQPVLDQCLLMKGINARIASKRCADNAKPGASQALTVERSQIIVGLHPAGGRVACIRSGHGHQ